MVIILLVCAASIVSAIFLIMEIDRPVTGLIDCFQRSNPARTFRHVTVTAHPNRHEAQCAMAALVQRTLELAA